MPTNVREKVLEGVATMKLSSKFMQRVKGQLVEGTLPNDRPLQPLEAMVMQKPKLLARCDEAIDIPPPK